MMIFLLKLINLFNGTSQIKIDLTLKITKTSKRIITKQSSTIDNKRIIIPPDNFTIYIIIF